MVTDGQGPCVALGPILWGGGGFSKSQAQLELSWTESVFPRSQCVRARAGATGVSSHPGDSLICLLLAVGDRPVSPSEDSWESPRPRPCPDYSRWMSSVFSRLCRVKPRRPDCQAHCPGLHQRWACRPLASSGPETLQQLAVQNQVTALLWPDASGQPCPVGVPNKTRDPRITNTGSGRSWGPTS